MIRPCNATAEGAEHAEADAEKTKVGTAEKRFQNIGSLNVTRASGPCAMR